MTKKREKNDMGGIKLVQLPMTTRGGGGGSTKRNLARFGSPEPGLGRECGKNELEPERISKEKKEGFKKQRW